LFYNHLMPDENEKVDWVRPIATGVPVNKLNVDKLTKASEKHGVKVDIDPGGKTATIVQEVVEGMPAPKK